MVEEKKFGDAFVCFLLTIAMLSFSGAFYAGKTGVAVASPMVLTFLRFVIALCCLLPFYLRQPREQVVPRREDYPLLCFLGFTGMFLYHFLFFVSLLSTSPVNASVIGSFAPAVMTVMAALLVHEPLPFKRVCALALALFGVLLALCRGDVSVFANLRFAAGDLFMLAAVFATAIYNTISKKALARYTPLSILTIAIFVAVLVSAPFFMLDIQRTDFRNPVLWASVAYMGVLPSCVGYLFLQIGVKHLGVGRAGQFFNLVPIFSILLSLVISGAERVTPAQVASSLIIIAGVVWNSRIK